MRALRLLALVTATLLVTASCQEIGDLASELRDGDPPPGEAPPGEAPPGEQPPDGPPVAATDDLGRVGANGRAMLRAASPRLVIEVLVQDGASWNQAALDHLVAAVRDVADKPGGISLAGPTTFASDRTQWPVADLRATADAHRRHYSGGDTVAVAVMYVRGSFHASDGSQTDAIGVAYNASETAVFPDRWRDLPLLNVLGGDARVERAVLVHEIGHLFGLVNISYQSDHDHEDPEHPHHSRHRDSVMYWAVETTAIGQVFSGPPPDRFGEFDLADLEGLRTGRH